MKPAPSRPFSIPLTAILRGQLRDRSADPSVANVATVARAAILRGLADPSLPLADVVRSDRRMAERRVIVRLDAATLRTAQDMAWRDGCSLAHTLRVALARGLGPPHASANEIALAMSLLGGCDDGHSR